MIFAAGKGTRLRPLTESMPKALVEVAGKPMLYWILHKLKQSGISSIIVNVHHFTEQILDYLAEQDYFGMEIAISHEEELLDTGGGLLKASWFFENGDDFLLHNVDVLSNIDFGNMLADHRSSGNIATLAVSKRTSSRYLLFDDQMLLCGRENYTTGERFLVPGKGIFDRFAFSGIHIINPEIFGYFRSTGTFSLMDEYVSIAETGRIGAYIHDAGKWIDMGRPGDLQMAEQFIRVAGNSI